MNVLFREKLLQEKKQLIFWVICLFIYVILLLIITAKNDREIDDYSKKLETCEILTGWYKAQIDDLTATLNKKINNSTK